MARANVTVDDPPWPHSGGRNIVFLCEVETSTERRLLHDWCRRSAPNGEDGSWTAIEIPSSRAEEAVTLSSELETRLLAGDDPLFVPLRIAWLPPERHGERTARLRDLLTFSNPRDPSRLQQRWISTFGTSDRHRVVLGDPAPAADLRARWETQVGTDDSRLEGLPRFVARQAVLANERAERRIVGNRYKVPHLVAEEIADGVSFRSGVARLANELGEPADKVRHEARDDLREIAAGHSPYVIDVSADLARLVYTMAYEDRISYDREALTRIGEIGTRHPLVFLPSHRTYLDTLVLRWAMHECGLPPNHVAAGINLSFFPLGAVLRRSGMFFIRRSFKDDRVYKFVLREYVDYLLVKRFSLEWFIEGGRSRIGKLLPPRFGLLAYVFDTWLRRRVEDVVFVPVSISYDQLLDVDSYAAEARGASKKAESVGFAIDYLSKLRQGFGHVAIGFGEPLSLRDQIGEPPATIDDEDPDERNLALQKIAFEVMRRINDVTPITQTSLVTLGLLSMHGRALTVDELQKRLASLVAQAETRGLPLAEGFDLSTPSSTRATLEALVQHGVVECFSEGADSVYSIGPDQTIAAAYYRNSIIHFFLDGAITEVALLVAVDAANKAAATGGAGPDAPPVDAFWAEAMEVRDLMKFEFFFAAKDEFRAEIRAALERLDPDAEAVLERGDAAGIQELLQRVRPFMSSVVFRSFVDAYRVVADTLAATDPHEKVDNAEYVKRCMPVGKQYLLQRRIRSADSVNKVLYDNALRLAANRGLLDRSTPNLGDARRAFADELRAFSRRLEQVEALTASRLAGLLD